MKKVVKSCFHMYFLMSSEILVNFAHYLVEYAYPYLQNRSKVGKNSENNKQIISGKKHLPDF